MDPASAIGTASAATTFLQFSYQFVRTIYDVYDGTKPSALETLGDVAKQMKTQSSQIISQRMTSHMSQDDIAIVTLAGQCQKLSGNLVKRVEQTEASSGKLQAAVRAAIKSLINKGEIVRLQAALENSRAQLHLHFQLSSR
jgi:hypothetical protein